MLSTQRRLLCLKIIVLMSMAGSVLSTFTLRQGWGEIYPFANWKLFTQPRGSKKEISFYRIYLQPQSGAPFVRQSVKPLRTFTQDEYVYTLDYLVNEALLDSLGPTSEVSKGKVLDFARYLYPGATAYKVVRENHRLDHPSVLPPDTATVLQFKIR